MQQQVQRKASTRGKAAVDSDESAPPEPAPEPEPTPSLVGKTMQVQGCSEDGCDFLCGTCPWEECVVLAEHGKSFDVRCCSDDRVCEAVLARFLRVPVEIDDTDARPKRRRA